MKLWMKMSVDDYEGFIQSKTFQMHAKQLRGADERYAYTWMGKELMKHVKRPFYNAKYPIILWYQREGKKHLKELLTTDDNANSIVLQLEVDEKEVVLFDERLFEYIKNFFYIPLDESDLKRFELVLDKLNLNSYKMRPRNVDNSAGACVRRMIEESWSRVFDLSKEDGYIYGVNSRKSIQAAVWQISIENVRAVYAYDKIRECVQVS